MVEAASAEDGLKVYKADKPDLIIVDLMMEEVDAGAQLVRELKAEGNTRPVYMLSSVGDGLSLNVDPASMGLSGVLQKPIDSNVLLKLIKAKLSH